MEYDSAMRKDEILPFTTTWMDLGNIMLSEISQAERVKNHMWNIKLKATNEQARKTNKNSDIHSMVVTTGMGVEGGKG